MEAREAREVDLLSAAGSAGVDDKAKRALGQLAAAIRQLPNEIPDAGQEQDMQKRRRDTEPAGGRKSSKMSGVGSDIEYVQ